MSREVSSSSSSAYRRSSSQAAASPRRHNLGGGPLFGGMSSEKSGGSGGASRFTQADSGVDLSMNSLGNSLPPVDLSLWLRRGSTHASSSSLDISAYGQFGSYMSSNDFSRSRSATAANNNNNCSSSNISVYRGTENRIDAITNNNLKLFSRIVDETSWLFPKEM